ncbi:MAG TPA: alpha/beta fold hydrolase [Polyangiaceae bacterium]|nr:alpha/beta fold hydrolase [Polyangiaceae bacterium]
MTAPLVLIHGFVGSSASWDGVRRSLDTAPALVSPLGHGEPGAPNPNIESWAQELERLVAALPAEPVHLAGYSLGARLALGMTLTYPARIARLTLVSGHTGLATDAERRERRESDARWCSLLEAQGIEAFVDAWEAQPLFATQAALPAALRAEHRAQRLAHDARGLALALRVVGLAEMPHYAPRLEELRIPVTVMAGELDTKFLTLARAAAERVRGSRFVVAPSAGHDLLLERPDLVALVLRDPNQKP